MSTVFIQGNKADEVTRIMSRLPLQIDQSLHNYVHVAGNVAVLISSDGKYHGDSWILSQKLAEERIDVKVVFDQHTDFDHRDSCGLSIPIPGGFLGNYSPQQIQSDPAITCLDKSLRTYASHNYHVYCSGLVPKLYLLGLGEENQEELVEQALLQVRNISNQRASLIRSSRLDLVEEIREARVHVSIDIDVLRGIRCVRPLWYRTDGPTLKQLERALKILLRNNELVALDIVGYVPGDLAKSPKHQETEGLQIYRRLVELIR